MALKLNSFDKMFEIDNEQEESQKSQQSNVHKMKKDILALPLKQLEKFKNHPFKEYDGDKLNEMIESIKEHGVITPILVRPVQDCVNRYEIVAGHNRVKAAQHAGLKEIPAIIKRMDDDTATIFMAESNFQQRTELLPSERAFAYKMQLEALGRQGKRRNFGENSTSTQLVPKLKRSNEEVAEHFGGGSRGQVQRYVRLTKLIPDLLDMVDNNKIPLVPAVSISHLNTEHQEVLFNELQNAKAKLSVDKAEKLKQLSKEGKLDTEIIQNILINTKQNDVHGVKSINIPASAFNMLFGNKNLSQTEISSVILIAVTQYFESQKK